MRIVDVNFTHFFPLKKKKKSNFKVVDLNWNLKSNEYENLE